MGTCPAFLVIKDHHRRSVFPSAGAICPQVGLACFASAGIKLAYRGFIGMQASLLSQQFGKPVGQRLQGHADAADPLRQRRAG